MKRPTTETLFASETIGAARDIDLTIDPHCDDTKRNIEVTANLSDEDHYWIYEGNARCVFIRLDTVRKAKGR